MSPGRIAPEDRRSEIGDRESSGAKPELPVCEQGRVDKAESLKGESEKRKAGTLKTLDAGRSTLDSFLFL